MASLAGHGAPHPPVRVSRVNAPFIPITVLPFAQRFTPQGVSLPENHARGGDRRPPGISLKGGYPGDWRRYGTGA